MRTCSSGWSLTFFKRSLLRKWKQKPKPYASLCKFMCSMIRLAWQSNMNAMTMICSGIWVVPAPQLLYGLYAQHKQSLILYRKCHWIHEVVGLAWYIMQLSQKYLIFTTAGEDDYQSSPSILHTVQQIQSPSNFWGWPGGGWMDQAANQSANVFLLVFFCDNDSLYNVHWNWTRSTYLCVDSIEHSHGNWWLCLNHTHVLCVMCMILTTLLPDGIFVLQTIK